MRHSSQPVTGAAWRLERASWPARLASLRITLAVLIALGAGIMISYNSEAASVWWIAGPLALGAINLAAAILFNRAIRIHIALLLFHVALLAIVILLAIGRLSDFRAHVELAEGEVFAGQVNGVRQGPLHLGTLEAVRFVNEGFSIRYAPGLRRAETVNWVRTGPGGERLVIGDSQPLVLEGYRFYTTFNKGFALVFTWMPADGSAPVTGNVHLPSYPLHDHEQAIEWTPPGTAHKVWSLLRFEKPPLDENRETRFAKPESHDLVVRVGADRHEIRQGQGVRLVDGYLRYDGLSTWMGYKVFYDWTTPWLFAACVVAIGCLGWHFASRFANQRWQDA